MDFEIRIIAASLKPDTSLPRLARDDCFRSRAAGNRRRCKDREISVAAVESIKADLAISDGGELAAQEAWRGTMLGYGSHSVDNAHPRVRLERGNEIVEQGVRLRDLVIHVHQNRDVDGISRQSRVVRLAAADCNILQSEIAHPVAQ